MNNGKRVSLLQARVDPSLAKRCKLAAVVTERSLQSFFSQALEVACARVEKRNERATDSKRTAA